MGVLLLQHIIIVLLQKILQTKYKYRFQTINK
jgi:hypothetical protein